MEMQEKEILEQEEAQNNEASAEEEDVQEEVKYLGSGTQLFYEEVAKYKALLENDKKKAAEIYGYSLFNSLDTMDKIYQKNKLGIKPHDAADHYNLGTFYLANNNYKKAIESLETALKMDKDLTDAYYNLAMAFEKSKKTKEAKDAWKKYISAADNNEEIEAIKQHVAEL